MNPRPLARPVGHARRRTAPVRRRSAGLTPVRAAALLVMLAAGALVYGLTSSPVFGLERLQVSGGTLTSEATIRATLGLTADPRVNLVTLDTSVLQARLEQLPTVAAADVSVGLPGTLAVTVTDRTPILVWLVGERQLLVDVEGRVIDDLGAASASPAAGSAAPGAPDAGSPVAGLPVVVDERSSAAALGVGSAIDPVDLDAARRLASLRPADVGSAAASLSVRIDDTDGFTVVPMPAGWVAVFGFYTPSQRTTDMIPGQVRLLRSLIAGREAEVGRVVLASATDGTYVPRPTPKASPGASTAASPSPAP